MKQQILIKFQIVKYHIKLSFFYETSQILIKFQTNATQNVLFFQYNIFFNLITTVFLICNNSI